MVGFKDMVRQATELHSQAIKNPNPGSVTASIAWQISVTLRKRTGKGAGVRLAMICQSRLV